MGEGRPVVLIHGRPLSDRSWEARVPALSTRMLKTEDNPDGGLDEETIAEFENGVAGDRAAFLEEFTTTFFANFASSKGTLDCIAVFARTDFRPDLERIDVPTLVIHGDSDGTVPFEVSGKRSHEVIADSSLVVVEGAPHGLNVTHADEFNGALIQFLGG